MLDLFKDLPEQFAPAVQGRVLLMDGDFPCYASAATVKTLPTALRRYQTLVETEKFLVNAEMVRVHVTPKGCNKAHREWYPTAQPYQGNRKDKPKPPLLHPLRDALSTHEWPDYWSVFEWYDREADDGLILDAHVLGDRAVMVSGDKDLQLTPGPLWIADEGRIDYIRDRFGWCKVKGDKIVGHGTKFFWYQMIMGDTADHVKGITRLHGKLAGKVAAHNVLKDITSEADAAEVVLRAYLANKQNPLAEAECLWLRRSLDDTAYRYLSELGLPDYLQQWLDSLNQYHIEVLAFKANEREQEYGEQETQPTTSTRNEASGVVSADDLPPWEGGCGAGCRGCSTGEV